tara:strand:- start:240 stop:1289 length:1050 start_codon:yes stop_codon:yes gene_type:complete
MKNVSELDENNTQRISIDLPKDFVLIVDELKREWGFRARGAVFKRLLEELLCKDIENDKKEDLTDLSSRKDQITDVALVQDEVEEQSSNYLENRALVLTGNTGIEIKDLKKETVSSNNKCSEYNKKPPGIDLPGFISKRANSLRKSLGKTKTNTYNENIIYTVDPNDIEESLNFAKHHWYSIYGNKPGESVIEASMIWLARDIWPQIDGTDNMPFTWTAACRLMSNFYPSWISSSPTFERVIVVAGILEDPFSAKNLKNRIPTLTRRFVNRFKRSNATSFQTLESTMTIHGALKLLGLPTQSGSALKLSNIREAYKEKALSNHPDAGGTTEAMRKLNEGYQLLKELYKK